MNIFKTLVLPVFSFSSILAFAGGLEGGGGVGVRCGNSLELLEVHEARIRNIPLKSAPQTEEEAIDFVSRQVGEVSWYPLFDSKEEYIQLGRGLFVEPIFKGNDFGYIEDENGDISSGQVEYVRSLPLSNDYGNYQIRENCKLEQIAYFIDGERAKLQIVKAAWDELDWLSKSVLVAHETLYAMDRNSGSIRDLARTNLGHNSEWTRNYLIKLFSVQGVKGIVDGLPQNGNFLTCHSKDDQSTSFYAYDSAEGITFNFLWIMDKSEFYQVKSELKGLSLDDLLNSTDFNKKSKVQFSDLDLDSGVEISIQKNNGKDLNLRVNEARNGTQVGESQTIYCN